MKVFHLSELCFVITSGQSSCWPLDPSRLPLHVLCVFHSLLWFNTRLILCSSPVRFWGLFYLSLLSTRHRAPCTGEGVNNCTRGLPKSRKRLWCLPGAPSVPAYMPETLESRETPRWWVRTHDYLITLRMIQWLWNYVYKWEEMTDGSGRKTAFMPSNIHLCNG